MPDFEPGDILRGSKRRRDQAYHPIIFLEALDDWCFCGGMLTHSGDYGNIKLGEEHFEKKINDDPRPNYFVPARLLKKNDWGPFQKVGKLSASGVAFVQAHLNDVTPQRWEDFISKEVLLDEE